MLCIAFIGAFLVVTLVKICTKVHDIFANDTLQAEISHLLLYVHHGGLDTEYDTAPKHEINSRGK